MRLIHFSADIVTKVHGRRQTDHLDPKNRNRGLAGKPVGFWISDETRGAHGWKAWCRAERFRSYSLRYEHEVKLSDKAKILCIRNAKELNDFADKYGYSLLDELAKARGEETFTEEMRRKYGRFSKHIDAIDWRQVAKKYHGIIITPYISAERLGDNSWYYPWDCASGCIWNARAIESVTMIKEHKVPRKPTRWELKRKHKKDMIKMAEASKSLAKSLAKTRPPTPLDKALVDSADKLIESYGGKK